jgi:hypothetical protein
MHSSFTTVIPATQEVNEHQKDYSLRPALAKKLVGGAGRSPISTNKLGSQAKKRERERLKNNESKKRAELEVWLKW